MSGPVSVLLAAAAAVQPGPAATFRDWAVACDNGGGCEAIALLPEAANGQGFAVMAIGLPRADGAMTLDLAETDVPDRWLLLIDGREIVAGEGAAGGRIALRPAEGRRLLAAMRAGRALDLRDARGVTAAHVSLSGSAAAMRWIAARRSDRGTSPVAIPPAPPAGGAVPPPAEVIALAESSACAGDRDGVVEDRSLPLGSSGGVDRALVLVACGNGAYNYSSAPFIGERPAGAAAPWRFAPARFDYPLEDELLVNADFDAARMMLDSHAKGRGPGDCGTAATYAWDGTRFRLTELRRMDACRGSAVWPTLWRRAVTRP